MRRQHLLLLAMVFLLTFSSCGPGENISQINTAPLKGLSPYAKDSRENIVFILSDDQDTESLGAMRELRRLLPLQFPDHILTTPVCCPSRETFLTGQYAHNHRVYSNSQYKGHLPRGRPLGGWSAAGSRKQNIGLWLQRSGYYTALIGKYLNGFGVRQPVPKGWDYFAGALGENAKGYFNYLLNENGKIRFYGESANEYSVTILADHVRKAMRQAERLRKPAFIFFSPPTPHSGALSSRQPRLNPEPHPRERRSSPPFFIPKVQTSLSYDESRTDDKPAHIRAVERISDKKTKQYNRIQRARWLSLLSLDREISQLVRWIEAGGRNSYFFYTTDNGYMLGQHRLKGKFAPYEESIRFPLLVRTPSREQGRREQLVGNIDFAPTVFDIAGIRKRPSFDGRSLLPLIKQSPKNTPSWREEILISTFPVPAKTARASDYRPYLAARSKEDVLVLYQKQALWPPAFNGEREYYNFKEDPFQMHSAEEKKKYQKRISYLKTRIIQMMRCEGVKCG